MESFKTDWNFIFFLNVADAGIWAYFILQFGFFLMYAHQLPTFFKQTTDTETQMPLSIKYLKRAGLALVVLGIVKLITLFYTALVMKSI
jgi:asparagine N-glycosylation enzyme membrane subunit Stt3